MLRRIYSALFVCCIFVPFCQAAGPTTAIKVDQAGYLPQSTKIAYVGTLSSVPTAHFFVRRSADHSIAFEGQPGERLFEADSGDYIQAADFSRLQESGRFYIDVPGVGRSWDFDIDPGVFRRVYYLAMRSYYGQRCGTAVDLGPEFPGYKHPACHLIGAYHPSSGKQGEHVSSRGWHDAGDYGRYVVNSGISTGTLLWAWELSGSRIQKIGLQLPESHRVVPDMLGEIQWNLDWMMTMQDGDGGVWQKQTSTHFCPFIMPENDNSVSYVIGTGQIPFKSSCATADFAAVMAIAGRVYRPFDPSYAEKCLRAAEAAWTWLDRNPDVLFHNPPGVTTGAYGDSHCGDERLWAAAELARTTGEQSYTDYFLQHYREYLDAVSATTPPSWSMVAPMALWTFVLGRGSNPEAVRAIREKSLQAADAISERAIRHGYRISLTPRDYIWGSNSVAANYSLQLLIANQFERKRQYSEAAEDNLHYILGRNTFSISWVTQVGENAFQHPHHRPRAADGIAQPWPGLMAGGPNPGRQDAVMKKLLSSDTPRARMYVDETGAYACNEIAINWNAPLVFSLAASLPEH
jgi:endoglucanase